MIFFVENSEVCNYADDNSLTIADINIDNIISKLESDIEILNTCTVVKNARFSPIRDVT